MQSLSSYRVLSVVALTSTARNGCFRMMEEDINKSLAAHAGQCICLFVTVSLYL